MNTSTYITKTGDCYRRSDGKYFRVLAISPDEDLVITVRFQCTSTRLRRVRLSELNAAFKARRVVPVIAKIPPLQPRSCWSDTKKAAFEKLQPALIELMDYGYFELSRRRLWADIVRLAGEIQSRPSTLNHAFSRVLMSGGVIEAAAPQWEKCGTTSLVDGKPTRYPGAYPMTVADLPKIADGMRCFYRDGASFKEAYQRTIEKHWAAHEEIIGDKSIIVPLPPEQCPSLDQFMRHGSKLVPLAERIVQQKGEHALDTDYRGRPTGQSAPAIYPGHVAEIDWTWTDIVAVNRGDRLCIGRLVLYAIADVFSGAILAAYVTLENAASFQAGRAILQVLEDKVELCGKYGLKIERDHWDVQELPSVLRCDRGEIDSWKTMGLCAGLSMRLEYCPPRRGDLKGTIESFFNVVRYFFRKLDGATSGRKERLKDHPAINAIYDIEELQRLLFVLVVRFNNTRKRRRQAFTPGMVESAVLPFAKNVYAWGKAHGCTNPFPIEEARLAVLPTVEANVTSEGIRIKGLRYKVPDYEAVDDPKTSIDADDWLIRARQQSWSVYLGIDETTVDFVWLWHRRQSGEVIPVKCSLSEEHAGYRGYTWPEYETIRKEDSQQIKVHESGDVLRIESWARAEIATMTAKSKAITEEARAGLSKREQIDGIDERRAAEKAALSNTSAAVPREADASDVLFDWDAA